MKAAVGLSAPGTAVYRRKAERVVARRDYDCLQYTILFAELESFDESRRLAVYIVACLIHSAPIR